MSSNRNDAIEHSEPPSPENSFSTKYEGFEGMNYEQPRQPYHPRNTRPVRDRSGKEPGGSEQNNTSTE